MSGLARNNCDLCMTWSPLTHKVNDGTLPDAAFYLKYYTTAQTLLSLTKRKFPTVFSQGRILSLRVRYQPFTATPRSLPVRLWDALLPEAARAGYGSVKNSAYTSFMAAKSAISFSSTVVYPSAMLACRPECWKYWSGSGASGFLMSCPQPAGSRVNGDLAGNVNGAACLDALGIRANGGGGFIGMQCGCCSSFFTPII